MAMIPARLCGYCDNHGVTAVWICGRSAQRKSPRPKASCTISRIHFMPHGLECASITPLAAMSQVRIMTLRFGFSGDTI
jgi:hypothetical protein